MILIATLHCINIVAQVHVVDADDGSVVPYANVYNATGTFLGTTDIDGILPTKATKEASIAITHINYQSTEILIDTLRSGIIALQPISYKLDNVTVSGENLDYICITAYARQYQIADAVPASFSEGVYEFYFPREKGKAKRHDVARREVFREDIANDKSDASFYSCKPPKMRRKSQFLSMAQAAAEAQTDTFIDVKRRKYEGKNIVDYNRKRGTCEVYVDSMFSEKPLTVNFLGIHFQITGYRYGNTYDITNGNLTFDKLLRQYDEATMRLWLNGKKGHITNVQECSELFVLSVGYVSKAQMKEAMKRETEQKVIVPPDISTLPKPLTSAIEKMIPVKQ